MPKRSWRWPRACGRPQPAVRRATAPVRAATGDAAGEHRRALCAAAGRCTDRIAPAGGDRLQRRGGLRAATSGGHAAGEPAAQPDPAAAAVAGSGQRRRAGRADADLAALYRGRWRSRRAAAVGARRAARPTGVRGLRLVRMRLGGLPEHTRGAAHRHGRLAAATPSSCAWPTMARYWCAARTCSAISANRR